ncbi:uncharacterized protein LOC141686038 [Apium graveolens]|uniref:uncharacterized protein LOC141686038 n=1 Tax=Apium graveolens TaxID=4045 RepID=UPI003D7B2633
MASDIEDIDEEYLSNNQSMWDGYLDLGAPDKICSKCDAVMWTHERNNKSSLNKPPTFYLCCKNGQVVLDKEKQPPEPLATLLTGGVHFKHFKKKHKVQGVNYHNIGSLVPTDDNPPKFCQLYIYDTEDEINNRMNAVNGCRDVVNEEIIQSLLHILDEHNRLVKGFRMARERVRQNAVDEFKLVLISSSSASGRPNHIAPSNEVAGLIITSPYAKGLTPYLGGRLWQQYVVDAFTAIEQYRLDWIRDHQTTIRSDLYHNIRDAIQKGDRNPSNIGHPSLFLTMTTNTKCPEIWRMLKHMPGVDVADAPDVVARVFKMKVDQLMDMIKKKNCFGRCIRVMHVIEFQKRGLPHAHILIWLHPDDRPKITEQIDKMVSAEIPDPEIDPVGYNAVSNYMIHGPCGPDYTKSPCMVKGNCIKHFPKRKTRTGTSATIPKKAPKGLIDEVKHFLDGRYVCGSEASWRIFAFDIHSCWPSVVRLPKHLPGEKHVSFKAGDVLEDVCDKTFPNARNYSYSEFPNKFTWHPQPGIWKERKRGDVIGRLSEVHSSSGELLYLRMLLLRKKGSMSFKDLKTVNGHIHEKFKEACAALGLLQNDNQWHEAISENSHTSLPPQLCAMFVNILAYSPISDPLRLWEANWQCMSDDILIIRRHMLNDPHLYLSDEDLKNYALAGLYLIIIPPE